MTDAHAQVGRKTEPAEVRHHAVGRDGIDGAPEVGEVGVGGQEGQDVGGRGDGLLGAEEQGRPDEVQGELDGVDGGGVPRGGDDGRGAEGRGADGPGPVGGVAHEAVEERPDGAEDPAWWGEGRLAEGLVCFYCFLVGHDYAHATAEDDGGQNRHRCVGEDLVRDCQCWYVGRHCEIGRAHV